MTDAAPDPYPWLTNEHIARNYAIDPTWFERQGIDPDVLIYTSHGQVPLGIYLDRYRDWLARQEPDERTPGKVEDDFFWNPRVRKPQTLGEFLFDTDRAHEMGICWQDANRAAREAQAKADERVVMDDRHVAALVEGETR